MEINSEKNQNNNELIFENKDKNNEEIKKKEVLLSPKKINIIFYFKKDIYNLVCEEDELLSSIFEKFKKKSQTENLDLYFISNGETLNPENKISQLYSNIIEVHTEREKRGGLISMIFTDLNKQIKEDHYFSDKAPSYRIVTQGINIFGICKVKKCLAYKKEVICPLRTIKKFDLIKEKDDLECPECGGNIIPKTIGFHRCEYIIKGKKYDNDKIESFKFEGKAENKNAVQYYNPDKNGETTLVELIIEITKDL